VYNSTCFELQALIIRSPSPYIQPPVSVFVCLRHCLVRNSVGLSCKKTVPQTDTNTETGGCMYSEGLLMMSVWRSKHVELYTYRQKIKIYHKLHLFVGLLIGIYEDARTDQETLNHWSFPSQCASLEQVIKHIIRIHYSISQSKPCFKMTEKFRIK
jgi:hypothetical protein